MHRRVRFLCLCLSALGAFAAFGGEPLAGTALLTNAGDFSAQMVAGIDRWLIRETAAVARERSARSATGFSTAEISARRARLRLTIGAVDDLFANPEFEILAGEAAHPEIYRDKGEHPFAAYRVRWPVLDGLSAEGLLLEPLDRSGNAAPPIACAIALPDADQPAAMLAGLQPGIAPASLFARHLVQSGWRVLVVEMASRDDTFSGSEILKRYTNQPHREWIYRQAYEVGRHIIGYEVQKVLAAALALAPAQQPLAIAGYGEGALVALHAAALEPRIRAALVSGYFGPREDAWREPIYRNVFGALREFGNAELAAMAAPAAIIVEHSVAPHVSGPPPARAGRGGAAPGAIATPEFGAMESEADRANEIAAKSGHRGWQVELVHGSEGMAVQFGSRKALAALAQALHVAEPAGFDAATAAAAVVTAAQGTNAQKRTVRDLESYTQAILRRSEQFRSERSWTKATKSPEFQQEAGLRRSNFWSGVIGKLEGAKLAPNARSRELYSKPGWTGYEVMLDVRPDIFAWGYLLVPKDLRPGERRPVVVCQHGLEGVPEDTVTDDPQSGGFKYYQAFAARLAERGFIVYSPHNPYRGRDSFRVLQRKANPLGLSLFSFIIAQHEVATDWLASLPFVDPQRIAFYGLSYGGKTAMRVPAVVERYCLSICSGDFNEWVQKNATTESGYSYMFTGEYEMPEWDLGHTFNYAEMAGLIFPRPFMVERGHDDGVAPDTWVAYEYAKVRRLYDTAGLGDRTEIEFFNGPHQIHGAGTFNFLHKHLNWPVKP